MAEENDMTEYSVDMEALERLAGAASGSGIEVLEDHGYGVKSVRLRAEELRAFRAEATPEAILSLIQRVREAEDKITEVPTICRRYEARIAELEGLLREARGWIDRRGHIGTETACPTCDFQARIDTALGGDNG